ncbi:MAG: lysophospholipid acyltransferase family protein [Geodermatophilaceae bacterium]
MFYWILKAILTPILRLLFRPKIEGLENIPERGPAILAPSHMAFCDSVFLPLMVPRRVTFLAKQEYFTGKGVKGWSTRVFMRGIGMVPIDRTSGSAAKAALETGERILSEGKLFSLYPEGTRSPDGRLYRGKTGVARLALSARVPVIPVVMTGTDKVQPLGRVIPRIHRVRIKIGAPLDFSRYYGMIGDRFVERSMTDELMYELMMLSGQEYVDVYAAKVKLMMDKHGTTAGEAVATMRSRSSLAA